MAEVSVTIVDLSIAAIVLMSAAYAAWRGLVRETLAIFSWALAAYLTLWLSPEFRPVLREYVAPDWLADFAAFAGIFLLIAIPLFYLSRRFAPAVQRTEIGPVDRSLGFVFGIARGLVVVALAYIVFSIMVPPQNQPAWLVQSRFFPIVENTSDVLLSLVPLSEDVALDGLVARPVGDAAPAQSEASETALNPAAEADQGYGAEDRAALDRLIETTGAP